VGRRALVFASIEGSTPVSASTSRIIKRNSRKVFLRWPNARLLDRESLHPRIRPSFLTVHGLFRAIHRLPLPVCHLDIAGRFSQRIIFKRLAFGVAHALNRLVVERR